MVSDMKGINRLNRYDRKWQQRDSITFWDVVADMVQGIHYQLQKATATEYYVWFYNIQNIMEAEKIRRMIGLTQDYTFRPDSKTLYYI